MSNTPPEHDFESRRERALHEAEDFINAHRGNPEFIWPTEWALFLVRPVLQPAGEPGANLNGMTVYVQGVYHLDRSVFIDVALPEFLAALRTNPEKLWLRWAFKGSLLGW
jgi:hypothetical protein